MSKPVKNLVIRELVGRFNGLTSLAVVNLTGVDAVRTTEIRTRLREKEISVTVVKNSLARKAFREVGLGEACDLLDGPCAVAWGADSVVTVVRELLDVHKQTKEFTVKAAVMEGQLFGPESIEALSKYPTKDEAIAQVIGCALSAGSNLAGCLVGPGGAIAGILKSIEEKDGSEAEAA